MAETATGVKPFFTAEWRYSQEREYPNFRCNRARPTYPGAASTRLPRPKHSALVVIRRKPRVASGGDFLMTWA